MVKAYRFAIVSFAHMHAYSYARVIKELEIEGRAVLEAIYDDNPSRLRKAADIYRPRKAYESFDKLLDDREIDAAVVASENSKHAKFSIPLMDRGVHILVEKPIATRLEDARRMVETADRRTVKLQMAFVMRYHDASRYIKNAANGIGRIKSITATNHGRCPFDWFVDPELAGGGAMMDHIVHVADLIRWYTGDEFYEVMAYVGKNIYSQLKVEDNALIIGRLRGGALVSIDCSWSRPASWPTWGDVYMHILGEKGAVILNAFNQNIAVGDEKGYGWLYFGPDADKSMIEDFIKIIEEDGKPLASGLDGVKALEVVIAAYKSFRERRPVRIDEIA
ncbi:MAG: Gfo/Idh/MocA family oxidoreductase [Ignisphaera sp.]